MLLSDVGEDTIALLYHILIMQQTSKMAPVVATYTKSDEAAKRHLKK